VYSSSPGGREAVELALGLLALAALTLTYHEPGAPRSVWLVLLALVALVRFLRTAARKLFNACRWIALVSLLVISYHSWFSRFDGGYFRNWSPSTMVELYGRGVAACGANGGAGGTGTRIQDARSQSCPALSGGQRGKRRAKLSVARSNRRPSCRTQGPGPDRAGAAHLELAHHSSMNGPVARDQQIRLWLLSPPSTWFWLLSECCC